MNDVKTGSIDMK